MKFEDLKLIQQVVILESMIHTPNVKDSSNGKYYRVPDSSFIIDILDSAKALMNVQNRTKGWRYLHEALTV